MKQNIKDYLVLILANFILAIATIYFVLPNNLVTGGLSGLALVVSSFIWLDKSILVGCLSLTLFIIGYLFMGFEFAKKTLLSSIVYPLWVYLLSFMYFKTTNNLFLISVMAGSLTGLGLGLAISHNGSSGGMDIPVIILAKYTKINPGTIIIFSDGLIILIGSYIYGLKITLFGVLALMFTSLIMKLVLRLYQLKKEKYAL